MKCLPYGAALTPKGRLHKADTSPACGEPGLPHRCRRGRLADVIVVVLAEGVSPEWAETRRNGLNISHKYKPAGLGRAALFGRAIAPGRGPLQAAERSKWSCGCRATEVKRLGNESRKSGRWNPMTS